MIYQLILSSIHSKLLIYFPYAPWCWNMNPNIETLVQFITQFCSFLYTSTMLRRFISQFKISQRPRRPIGHQAIRLIFQELVAFGWRNTLRDEKSEKLSNSRSFSGRRQTRQASGAGESLRHGKIMGK